MPSSHSQISAWLQCLPYILVGVFGLFSWFSRRNRPIGKSEIPTNPESNSDDTANIGPPVGYPIRVIIDRAPKPPAPTEEQKAKEKRAEHRERKKYRAEILAVVIAFGLLAVNGGLWWEQDIAMKKDQRAWVSAEIGEKEGHFYIAMHNSGKTPALKVTYTSAFSAGKLGIIPKVDLSQNSLTPIDTSRMPPTFIEGLKKEGLIPDHPLSGFVIAPNKSEIASYFGGHLTNGTLPADMRLYIQGRFTYEDIFGKPHETRFCYWYATETEFPMCSDNNSMN